MLNIWVLRQIKILHGKSTSSKREELKPKLNKYYWLLGRNSQLAVYSNILNKQIFKSVWFYGIQLRLKKLMLVLCKNFKTRLENVWWMHRDLLIPTIKDEINKRQVSKKSAYIYIQIAKKLKRTKPQHLVLCFEWKRNIVWVQV